MKHGILLFAHGARDPRWAEPHRAIADAVRSARPEAAVGLAFLEFMQPDLEGGLAALQAAGASRIDVVPLFLGMGGHLREDLPPLVERARAARPDVEIRLHPAIGEDAAVIAAIARAAVAVVDPATR